MEREYFKINRQFADELYKLPLNLRDKIFCAIVRYFLYGTIPTLTPSEIDIFDKLRLILIRENRG